MDIKTKRHLRIVWQNMKNRCFDPTNHHYKDYGGRGITICKRWYDFNSFFNDMIPTYKKGLQIDRKDNMSGYSIDNCQWVDKFTQANNKRNNHLITYNGQTKTLAEWSKYLNIPYSTLISRINKRNWPIKEAFEKPRLNPAKERLITYNGKTHNISKWSEITGINTTTLMYRFQNNFPIDKIFKNPKTRKKQTFKNHHVTYNGKTLLVSEWAKLLDINYGTFISRFKAGWPIEQIMSTPASCHNKLRLLI